MAKKESEKSSNFKLISCGQSLFDRTIPCYSYETTYDLLPKNYPNKGEFITQTQNAANFFRCIMGGIYGRRRYQQFLVDYVLYGGTDAQPTTLEDSIKGIDSLISLDPELSESLLLRERTLPLVEYALVLGYWKSLDNFLSESGKKPDGYVRKRIDELLGEEGFYDSSKGQQDLKTHPRIKELNKIWGNAISSGGMKTLRDPENSQKKYSSQSEIESYKQAFGIGVGRTHI